MSEARDAILGAIRHALTRKPSGTAHTGVREGRAEAGSALGDGIRPTVQGELVTLFAARITAAGASLVHLPSLQAVPQTIGAFLDEQGLDHALVCSGEQAFEAIPWPTDFRLSVRTATDGDHTSLTGVLAAVAETGSLVVASGRQRPNTLHFLAQNHIALVRTAQVLRHLEDVWQLLRTDAEGMPRALTFITGPSRTADVEQTLQIGAHGPKRLLVLLVDDQLPSG